MTQLSQFRHCNVADMTSQSTLEIPRHNTIIEQPKLTLVITLNTANDATALTQLVITEATVSSDMMTANDNAFSQSADQEITTTFSGDSDCKPCSFNRKWINGRNHGTPRVSVDYYHNPNSSVSSQATLKSRASLDHVLKKNRRLIGETKLSLKAHSAMQLESQVGCFDYPQSISIRSAASILHSSDTAVQRTLLSVNLAIHSQRSTNSPRRVSRTDPIFGQIHLNTTTTCSETCCAVFPVAPNTNDFLDWQQYLDLLQNPDTPASFLVIAPNASRQHVSRCQKRCVELQNHHCQRTAVISEHCKFSDFFKSNTAVISNAPDHASILQLLRFLNRLARCYVYVKCSEPVLRHDSIRDIEQYLCSQL